MFRPERSDRLGHPDRDRDAEEADETQGTVDSTEDKTGRLVVQTEEGERRRQAVVLRPTSHSRHRRHSRC